MFKSVLVAMDDSLSSEAASKVAVNLCNSLSAKLKGLYIEDISRLLQWGPASLAGVAIGASVSLPENLPVEEQVAVEEEFIKEYDKAYKFFQEQCKTSNIKGDFYKQRGQVDTTLVHEVKKADLLVIGKRGKTYPEQSHHPGPTTEAILRSTVRPVLVVPKDVKINNSKTILIAYDCSDAAQRALYTGVQFATITRSKIILLTVSDDKEFVNDCHSIAREYISPYELNTVYLEEAKNISPWEGILTQANNFEVDYIVSGAFGSNKLKELLFGSTTQNLLIKSEVPVLLVK